MRKIALLFIASLAACSSSHTASAQSSAPKTAAPRSFSALQNGQAIFTSGRDLAGHPITAASPPIRAACIQCHGANGAGGVKFPDGAVSADLRHKALVTEQKPPYTIPLLMRAISTGVDNQGEKLDPVMPRWKMSPRDLHDVAVYVYEHFK